MKKMKNVFALIVISLVFFSSCELWSPGIEGEGSVIEQSMVLADIEGFQVSIAADVIVTYGDTQEVRIIAQENIIENIETRVENNIWNITFDKRVKNYDDVTIYITLPKLSDVGVSGSSDIVINDGFANGNTMNVKVSGSADIDFVGTFIYEYFNYTVSGSLNFNADTISCNNDLYSQVSGSDNMNIDYLACQETIFDVSGSSDISLNGGCNIQYIYASGSIDYHAVNYNSNKTYIDISGSADMWVFVANLLDIRVSGSAHIRYRGAPAITQNNSGSLTLESI